MSRSLHGELIVVSVNITMELNLLYFFIFFFTLLFSLSLSLWISICTSSALWDFFSSLFSFLQQLIQPSKSTAERSVASHNSVFIHFPQNQWLWLQEFTKWHGLQHVYKRHVCGETRKSAFWCLHRLVVHKITCCSRALERLFPFWLRISWDDLHHSYFCAVNIGPLPKGDKTLSTATLCT